MSKNHDPRIIRGAIFLTAYLATIIISAWLVVHVGVVPVGLGLVAPAGAYVIGLTLVLRDITQDQLGPRATYGAVLVGTTLSALISPEVALGSAAAFLISETIDMLIYTPIRKRGHIKTAILTSNLFGIVLDSYVFLTIAFGDLTFFWGQAWAKLVSTLLALAVISLIFRNRNKIPAYIRAKENTNA